jgi:hypothetical protein
MTYTRSLIITLIVSVALRLTPQPVSAQGTTQTVTNGGYDGGGSLRWALD